MTRRFVERWWGEVGISPILVFSLMLLAQGTAVRAENDESSPASASTSPGGVNIRIQVVDPDGLPLPGAAVEIRARGKARQLLIANKLGEVVFAGIPCDTVVFIQARFPGMPTVRVEGVPAHRTASDSIRVCLDQPVVEHITLIHPGPIVDLDKSRTSTAFSASFLADLPGSRGFSRPGPVRKSKRRMKKCEAVVTGLAE
jgi:hypothetical protein